MPRAVDASGLPARAVLMTLLLVTAVAPCRVEAASADPLVEERAPIIIDWRRGVIQAMAGAAADHRMPSTDAVRPGAERRARAAGQAHLREALRALPLGGGRHLDAAAVNRAVGRARVTSTEYQSNGGVLLRMEVSFCDWMPENPQDVAGEALLLSEGRLAAAPLVFAGGREVTLACARYRMAIDLPAGLQPKAARFDKKGRLVVSGRDNKTPGAVAEEFADRPVVVYVHKITR